MEHLLKKKIDMELSGMIFTDEMKKNVYSSKKEKSHSSMLRYVAALAIVFMLSGTTVLGAYIYYNKVNVNDTIMPELDEMKKVSMLHIYGNADEYGMVDETFTDYDEMKSKTGIALLDSELAGEHSYMQGRLETDNQDFAILTIDNFILGDTCNYQYLPEERRYQYEQGTEYKSPVSLSIDIILSEKQLENGWDTDYLGLYECVESYTSAQGYRVNLIQDTLGEDTDTQNYVSEKIAVFVADGIRYTLKGRTSTETMKEIVDSME